MVLGLRHTLMKTISITFIIRSCMSSLGLTWLLVKSNGSPIEYYFSRSFHFAFLRVLVSTLRHLVWLIVILVRFDSGNLWDTSLPWWGLPIAMSLCSLGIGTTAIICPFPWRGGQWPGRTVLRFEFQTGGNGGKGPAGAATSAARNYDALYMTAYGTAVSHIIPSTGDISTVVDILSIRLSWITTNAQNGKSSYSTILPDGIQKVYQLSIIREAPLLKTLLSRTKIRSSPPNCQSGNERGWYPQ